MAVGTDLTERNRRIADLAYRLWREEGFPEGRDLVHWLEAERVVDQQQASPCKGSAYSGGKSPNGGASNGRQ
jgi:hypothetical protein